MMFDPELKYCLRCQDEYRADIEKCPACKEVLLSGEVMLAREKDKHQKTANRRFGELRPEDDLVTIRRGPLAEMKIYEQLLNIENIRTLLAGDESSCGKGCCGGNFDLVVRREEATDAVQIIEAEIRRTAVIDPVGKDNSDSVFDPLAMENNCPACGHSFSGGMECPDCGLCF